MQNDAKKPLIVLTAGGTGGHVYPAEALATELDKRGYALALITDKRGRQNYKGMLGNIDNYAVLSGAFMGKSMWFKIKTLIKTATGVLQAMFLLMKLKPVCVVGFGGYASFPACVAAILLKKNLVIHEQNSVMSRTNRLIGKYAKFVAQSFENVKFAPANVKNVLTGMPIRENIAKLSEEYEFKVADKLKILVIGGSQGAAIFSQTLPNAFEKLPKEILQKIKLVQQCRKEDAETVMQKYKKLPFEFEVSPFFDNMTQIYANSNLVISRAGASSVYEIAAVGLPSVLVPLPTAADNHQEYNTKKFKDENAALVLLQDEFTEQKIQEIIVDFVKNPQKLEKMSQNVKKIAIVDAGKRFADALETYVVGK